MRITFRRLRAALAMAAAGGLAVTAGAQFRMGYSYTSGKDIYEHVCQGCHMPNAKGAIGAGAYPALANNAKLGAAFYPITVVLKGQKAMPSFSTLTDAQVAEVVTYIRTNFGNTFPAPVTADQVKRMRPQGKQLDQRGPG